MKIQISPFFFLTTHSIGNVENMSNNEKNECYHLTARRAVLCAKLVEAISQMIYGVNW